MEKVRKKRVDAKKDIKPFLPKNYKDLIYRLSYITQTPVKTIAEYFIITALNNKNILNEISKYFKRDIIMNQTLYKGHINNPSINAKKTTAPLERISMRLQQKQYNQITAIAYALDCSKAKACAYLLEFALRSYSIVDHYVKEYLEKTIDRNNMEQLKEMYEFINNTDDKIEYTWAALLSHIINSSNKPYKTTIETVTDFIINNWKDRR